MDNKPIMVSICCLTYNHAPYIRECLDGFLKQQVNFPMEIIVHDDASTDGTQDILREYKEKYPDLFHLILQTENQYSKGRNIIVDYLFREIKGEYFAFCEGDDYWTDSHKLQKQVDFLETHSDYSLCCHLTPVYLQKERLIVNRESPKQIDGDSDVSFSLVDWVNWGYFFQTSSVVGRVSSLDMLFLSSFKVCKDLHLFYSLLEFKKGYFIKTPMSVYRVHDVGAWSGLSFENQKLVALTDIYDINGCLPI